MLSSPVRVTCDTNACNVIHNPDKWPDLVQPDDARKIRSAIEARRIEAFVSEASLFVECLSFPDKLAYLAVAGTPDPRPAPDPRMLAMFADLGSIGVKVLHAPVIGAEKFSDAIPWAGDDVCPFNTRHQRFCDFVQPLPRHHPLQAYGTSLLAHQQPVPPRGSTRTGPNSFSVPLTQEWAVALKREWDSGNPDGGTKAFRKKVGGYIGEWCDCLIVGSHVGYGIDIFCTTDEGKNAGAGSLLHHLNRPNLAGQGIRIMTPHEVVAHLGL